MRPNSDENLLRVGSWQAACALEPSYKTGPLGRRRLGPKNVRHITGSIYSASEHDIKIRLEQ